MHRDWALQRGGGDTVPRVTGLKKVGRQSRPSFQASIALGLHVALPFGDQLARSEAVSFVEKFGGYNAIRPEAAKILAQFAPGRQEAHGLGIADDRRPDRPLALARLFVAIVDPDLESAPDP